jgi:hypothetical protein
MCENPANTQAEDFSAAVGYQFGRSAIQGMAALSMESHDLSSPADGVEIGPF